MVAAELHYPSLPALMAHCAPTLVFDWWSNGYSLNQFLSIQVGCAICCSLLLLLVLPVPLTLVSSVD